MRRREYPGPLALDAMQELAVRCFPRTGYRHIGDLAWSWCRALTPAEEWPTAVWTEGGRTLAWGWLEPPGELMLQVDPSHPELAAEVLHWATTKSRGPLSAEVADTEPHLITALTRQGHTRLDIPFMSCLSRPLTPHPASTRFPISSLSPESSPALKTSDLPSVPELLAVPPLPDGYSIRPQRTPSDVAGRAAVHRAAWDSTRITTERHTRLREVWPYRPEMDLVAVSPIGEIVAYCQGWYDEANRVGLYEPVGTHPAHRRLGLSAAVCTAVLHAFAEAGAEHAAVYARGDAAYPVPKHLYESLGFREYTRVHAYVARPKA
ncbi:GNAT family N-acetyltransferase [Sphaerisporangium aureirubrum]|uniref:GNAT family N-acetyltransferase n=1 Tax=Sphaerisporangium aureirubrum TaxID=1544736 RepID=A0ABW1NW64_9ACTN